MNKILKTELKAALNASPSSGSISMPGWIVDRVLDITAPWYPFVKASPLKKFGPEKETHSTSYFVNPNAENLDDDAERLQEFYSCLAQDMRVGGRPPLSKRRERGAESDDEDGKERDRVEHEMMESESRIRDIMEVVERAITSLFYDRFVSFYWVFLKLLILSVQIVHATYDR